MFEWSNAGRTERTPLLRNGSRTASHAGPWHPRPGCDHRPIIRREASPLAWQIRERGVAAEATPRRARGQGIAGSSMALVKLRARLASGVSRVMTESDRRTNEQAIAVARGQAELPPFIAKAKTRWQEIRHAYSQAAAALNATGQSDDRILASDVRGFLDKHPDMNATPEIFAVRHARNLSAARSKPEPPTPDRGRGR